MCNIVRTDDDGLEFLCDPVTPRNPNLAYSFSSCNIAQVHADGVFPACLQMPDKSGVVRSRSPKSEAAYRRRYEGMKRTLQKKQEFPCLGVKDVIDDLRNRAPLIAAKSYYVYKASILQTLRDMWASGAISEADAETLVARMTPDGGTTAIGKHASPGRTSAGRRKSSRPETICALATVLGAKATATAQNLADIIEYSPHIGLRPSEFWRARLEGTTLTVRSVKFSEENGRGLATDRILEVDGVFDEFDLDGLRRLFARLAVELQAANGNVTRLVRRYAAALREARKCVPAERFVLNTGRHQCRANLRRAGYDNDKIAAVMGHISIQTGENYGRANKGWRPVHGQRLVEVPADLAARVRPGARMKAKIARGQPTTLTEARKAATRNENKP